MSRPYDLSIWDADTISEYDEWRDLIEVLDMTLPEIEGWLEACKREAWVHEKLAKYREEDGDGEQNLAIARYFWRRVERLREHLKQLEHDLDEEAKEAKT